MENTISINYFQKAGVGLKARIREFYGEILGWKLEEVSPRLDIFTFAEASTYGVQYTDDHHSVLSDEGYRKSTWLSIRSERRDELVESIKRFGVEELLEQSDESNYFFQAPGGQVYVVGK